MCLDGGLEQGDRGSSAWVLRGRSEDDQGVARSDDLQDDLDQDDFAPAWSVIETWPVLARGSWQLPSASAVESELQAAVSACDFLCILPRISTYTEMELRHQLPRSDLLVKRLP